MYTESLRKGIIKYIKKAQNTKPNNLKMFGGYTIYMCNVYTPDGRTAD